jgi:hypothetical protein
VYRIDQRNHAVQQVALAKGNRQQFAVLTTWKNISRAGLWWMGSS